MFFARFLLIISTLMLVRVSFQCDLPDGTKGKCMEKRWCPRSVTRCSPGGNFCCPMFERIVTPNNVTPGPVVAPPVEVTTKIMTPASSWAPPTVPPVVTAPASPSTAPSTRAKLKCEEYKRRIKKRASITTYVFGGTESLSKEFPHMAALGYGQPSKVDWLCGGSLVSDYYVITAAHCLLTSNLGTLIRVRLGDLNLLSNSDDAQPSDYGVAQTMTHPLYHLPTQYNDVGLIKLDRQVQFSAYVSPICLQVDYNLPNYNFIASGWGKTELGGGQSDVLMKVNLDYSSADACQRNYAVVSPEALPYGIVDASQICAGSFTDDRDTCQVCSETIRIRRIIELPWKKC